MAKKGGSAVDAAIAGMICVGVLQLQATGVGGGHFMTIYDTPRNGIRKEVTTIIAREMAPAFAHRDMFVNNSYAAQKGGLSICSPGEVKGYYEAWQRFGRVPWRDLWTPSIELCKNGHRVTPSLRSAIRSGRYPRQIQDDPYLKELLMKRDRTGKLVFLETGDIIKRPKLARTLERIAADPHTFYNGSLADDIVEDIKQYGGNITLQDLKDYRVAVKPALNITLDGGEYIAYSPRPPSSGLIFSFILNILKGYNLGTNKTRNVDDWILAYHRIVEAFKFAYAKRSALGDEDHIDVQELVYNLTSDAYCDKVRQAINDTHTQDVNYYEPAFGNYSNHGTAHLSVIAPDGAAASITSTINRFFGSNVRGNRTGIFFNDIMDDFSTPGTVNHFGVPASPSNFIKPGKRPMSSMAPAIVVNKDGHVIHITGASGGTRITTAECLVLMNDLWFKRPLVDSTNFPRLHHQLVPHYVLYESNFPQEIIQGLAQKGHNVRPRRGGIAVVAPISNRCHSCSEQDCFRSCITAVTDGRRQSRPDGY